MKVVFLNKYQFQARRGAETFVFELAKRLSQVYDVKIMGKINYFNLLNTHFDVIIPTNGRVQVFITRIVSWLKGARMIVSGQSGAGLDDRINLYALPDVFVGLTSFQSEWAKKINPFIRVVTIPNGVDLEKFKPPRTKKTGVVLAVGAFTKEKRHDLTIRAVARMPNVKLIIAGSGGPERDSLLKLGDKLLGKRFETVSVDHDKMPELYKKATVFAFPTVEWESFGIVLLEAMASGLPVVATDDPIRREIVGDCGILVDPTNIKKYSESLKKAFKLKPGKLTRSQAEKYSWDKIALSYVKLIEDFKHKNEN